MCEYEFRDEFELSEYQLVKEHPGVDVQSLLRILDDGSNRTELNSYLYHMRQHGVLVNRFLCAKVLTRLDFSELREL